jgi:hypothetical protein
MMPSFRDLVKLAAVTMFFNGVTQYLSFSFSHIGYVLRQNSGHLRHECDSYIILAIVGHYL